MALLEVIIILVMVVAVPTGAHGTVVGVCIANLVLLAWFWYNLVRSVDVTSEGSLHFWIGNVEVNVPFDRIVSVRRVATSMPCSVLLTATPYRGILSNPADGVAIATSLPTQPLCLWPRSAGRPERKLLCLSCPRLTVVFSPHGGGANFCREVENELLNYSQRQQDKEMGPPTNVNA